jgi:hypothetical protein
VLFAPDRCRCIRVGIGRRTKKHSPGLSSPPFDDVVKDEVAKLDRLIKTGMLRKED